MNVIAKLIAAATVTLFPLMVTLLEAPFSVHWLLDTVPATPGVRAGVWNPVAALLERDSRPVCGLYWT